MFTFGADEKRGVYVIEGREFEKIKQTLIFNLTNGGKPQIILKDANHDNAGELLLEHKHTGIPLKRSYAEETLKNIFKIWKKPVVLETKDDDGNELIMNCWGDEVEVDGSDETRDDLIIGYF
jgi:stage V sporulation protein R